MMPMHYALKDFPDAQYVGAVQLTISEWRSYWVTTLGQVLYATGALPKVIATVNIGVTYPDRARALAGAHALIAEQQSDRRVPWANDLLPTLIERAPEQQQVPSVSAEGPADALTAQWIFGLHPSLRR